MSEANPRRADPAPEPTSADGKTLTPAAQRALAEAAERRRAAEAAAAQSGVPTKEINGRGGAEPVRYGDWEVKGLATDF